MSARSGPAPIQLADLIDGSGWSGYQKLVLALASLAFMVDGLANQVLGLAIPSLVIDWSMPRRAFAAVAAIGLIGVATGSALGGLTGDRYGRRKALIGSVLLFGSMTAASSLVRSVPELMVLRLLAGLGIGGAIPNCAALVSEFTPLRHRSTAIAIAMAFIPAGGLLSGAIGSRVLPTLGWRGLFAVVGLLPILVGVLFLLVLPESLRFVSRFAARRAELLQLVRRCQIQVADDMTLEEEQQTSHRARLAALLAPGTRINTVALWTGFFFCLLASYTMFSWVPSMLSGQGFSLAVTSQGLTVFNFGGLVGGLAGGAAIARFGSRTSLTVCAAGSMAGAIVLGLMPINPRDGFLLVGAALLTQGLFISGLHNGLYTVATHLYPPYMRATGVGSAAGIGRIGAVLSSYTGVLALELGGESAYFILIAIAVGIALIAVLTLTRHIPAVRH